MTKEKMVTCPSCGGVFSELLPKCPYCETLNPRGAEKAYMDKLEKLRGGMDEMQDDVGEGYVRNLKKSGFKVGRVFAVILIIIGAMILMVAGTSMYAGMQERKTVKEEMAFRKAYFPELDKLYAAGDDDAVLDYIDTLYEIEGSTALWSWKHYDFYYLYRQYKTVLLAKEAVGEKPYEKVTKDLITDAAFYSLEMVRSPDYGLAGRTFTEEEKAKVLVWQQEEKAFLTDDLHLTEQEIDELYEASLNKEYQYLEHRKFESVFGEILDKTDE